MPKCHFGLLARLIPVLLLLTACSNDQQESTAASAGGKPPNILMILADDLGYSDIGIFGGEIPTPNIDALARNGQLLTDFHANMTCSPTRSMLMSGTDSHLAGLGVMNAARARDDQKGQPGYEGYLNFRVASLADLMTDAGYNTYMTGKWHLGSEVYNGPKARGFKRSFISLDGAAHLGPWDWRGPQDANYRDGDELVHVDDSFYSTRFYTERMISYIEQDRVDGKPFFAYLAYTAPHWPLQAPDESIAKFQGKYNAGFEALYLSRFHHMKELGLIPDDAEPVNPDDAFEPRWDSLSPEEQRLASRRMEVYAAMVSDLDTYIGKVIDYLKSIDEFDNTFIMFMSDNGAEPGRRDLARPIKDHVGKEYDNSYENMGRPTSYIMYGRNWATASETPFRRHKFTAFEGGIHVPAFVHYKGLVKPGTRNNGFGTVMDLMPTFLALAGTQHPDKVYKGKEILPIKGTSLLPLISGETDKIHPDTEMIGWELYGHRSIRQGDWKIVWDRAQRDNAHWMLFNLKDDPYERNDIGPDNPEKLAEMISLWDQYAKENGVIY